MSQKTRQGGFIPLLIIVIIAALAIGGGVYYVKHKQLKMAEQANIDASTTAQVDGNMTASSTVSVKNSISLRSLLSLAGNKKCTVMSPNSSGTVYFSNGSMRGDFTSKVNASSSVESHIIKSGDTAYVWSGSQGAKMNVSVLMQGKAVQGQSKTQIDLDQNVEYQCQDWTPDNSEFAIPGTIKFMDISAMMNGDIKLPAGVKVNY